MSIKFDMVRLTFLIIELIIAIASLLCGLILILKPKDSINIQQNFYKRINWKIEPINYDKEVRNTRIMGGICIVSGLILLIILSTIF